MASLTPDEQRFFETGELPASLQANAPAPAIAPAPPPHDPLDVSGLSGGFETQAPAQAPAAEPAPAPTPAPIAPDAAEILRQSLADAQRQVGALQQQIQQSQTQAPAVEPPAPDPTTDPLGAMMHELAQVNKTVLALQTQIQQTQQQQLQQTQIANFQAQVRSMAQEFAKATPDFNAAYQYLRSNREADLLSYGLTREQVNQAMQQEETVLADNAIRQAKNPAAVLYDMAKRHGYTPAATPAASPAPAQTPAAAPSAQEKLTGIAANQSAARNLPREPDHADVSIESLRGASEADLNRLVTDPASWSRIAGGNNVPI